jgi:hypothetical protein
MIESDPFGLRVTENAIAFVVTAHTGGFHMLSAAVRRCFAARLRAVMAAGARLTSVALNALDSEHLDMRLVVKRDYLAGGVTGVVDDRNLPGTGGFIRLVTSRTGLRRGRG